MNSLSIAVANSILKRFFDDGKAITPLKLQKLLYFVYKKYLYDTRTSLLTEHLEAWPRGPVSPVVYQAFKHYGSSPIDDYAKINNKINMINSDYIPFWSAVEYVYHNYGDLDAITLVNITHEQDTAWDKAYNGKDGRNLYISDEDVLAERWH